MVEIYQDKEQYESLINKYQSCKKEIDDFIEYLKSRYNRISEDSLDYPLGWRLSDDKKHYVKYCFIEKIKDSILMVYDIPERKEPEKRENNKEAILTRRGQIEEFWKRQPFFYDKSKIFYLWNDDLKKWEISDEVDFLNSIQEKLGLETIDAKIRTELIEGFKQIGRKHIPRRIKRDWVQFKEKIYSGKTGKFLFEATPEYFVKNPIPYNLGNSEETPIIDKLFIDWVGEENKIKLYELFAYAITTDRFMQRIYALCGGGSNGKGTCINKLLRKFLGEENIVSSEIKEISENQFENAVLFGKLVCVMGEVFYDDLRNTNQLKKIAGEDLMRFCFKGKTPFTDENTALCICLTNSLPTTPDKSLGFYRKWLIIDFPNQFPELKENLIVRVPEIEFENLALRCLNILKGFYENPKFTNEGDFDERIKRYEERSNPVIRFVEECCEETEGANITLRDFSNKCNEFLKSKHLKILTAKQIGKILRDDGFMVGNRKIGDVSAVVIVNLRFKTIKTIKTINNLNQFPHKELNRDLNSNDSNNSSSIKILNSFTDEEIKKAGYTREQLEEVIKKENV